MQSECARLCGRSQRRGRDRHLHLDLRHLRAADSQPRARRAAGDDQPVEHVHRPDALGPGSGSRRPRALRPERPGDSGRRFSDRLGATIGERPYTYSVYAAQATDLLLDAIGRSDGGRASVVRELFAARVQDGILGSFAIDSRGDTTARTVSVYRYTRGRPRLWQVIEPPAGLV